MGLKSVIFKCLELESELKIFRFWNQSWMIYWLTLHSGCRGTVTGRDRNLFKEIMGRNHRGKEHENESDPKKQNTRILLDLLLES